MTLALLWMPGLTPSLTTCICVGAVRQHMHVSQSVLTCAEDMFGTSCIEALLYSICDVCFGRAFLCCPKKLWAWDMISGTF